MTDETFAMVRRGYDPAQVDSVLNRMRQSHAAAIQEAATQTDEINQLNQALEASQGEVADLKNKVKQLEAKLAAAQTPTEKGAPTTDFTDFGGRIAEILNLAQAEADDIRLRAEEDSEAMHAQVAQEVERSRNAADTYAQETRSKADNDAVRVLMQAKSDAEELLDAADRESSARRQEAEAVFERQRAAAGAAAAEFEAALAERRDRAAEEFALQMANHERALTTANDKVLDAQNEAERIMTQARADASAIQEHAAQESKSMLDSARATAERVRKESERELTALAARRDSITEQLASVRTMLATLGESSLSVAASPVAAQLAATVVPGEVTGG